MKADVQTLRSIFGYPKGNYSIDNIEDIKEIIFKFTSQDLTPRTMKGHDKRKLKDPVYNPLAESVHEFIRDSGQIDQKTFDRWHKKVCGDFQDNFDNNSGMSSKLPYGKAQKIVNMTFKNLLCCKGAEQYADRFKYCHMPLDSYTLDDWFKTDVLNWYNEQQSNKTDRVTKSSIASWSNLDYDTYIDIQNKIRDYLKSANHIYKTDDGQALTSLQAEFYIWPEQKWLRTTKNLLDQDILKDTYPKYSHSIIAKQIEEFKIIFETLKNFN